MFISDKTGKLNTVLPRPADQEVFAATPWRVGNAGITKKQNYNHSFQMLYRVVYTDRILLDYFKSPVKKVPETQYSQGFHKDVF